jgi:hypothetical protein
MIRHERGRKAPAWILVIIIGTAAAVGIVTYRWLVPADGPPPPDAMLVQGAAGAYSLPTM